MCTTISEVPSRNQNGSQLFPSGHAANAQETWVSTTWDPHTNPTSAFVCSAPPRDRKLLYIQVGKSAFIPGEGRKGVHFYHFPGVVRREKSQAWNTLFAPGPPSCRISLYRIFFRLTRITQTRDPFGHKRLHQPDMVHVATFATIPVSARIRQAEY